VANVTAAESTASGVRGGTSHRRLDIQGMRALAVIMVVVFHAGLHVPGGFVGVDVFFVISGFVITAMLHREWVTQGRIVFRRFYLNRFKRLTPALALMVTVTILISSAVLYPFEEQENAVKTAFGALFLVANFVISKTTGGYFDEPAEANPLLHTWSLSVEEQFYLVFPAVLALTWVLVRRSKKFRNAPIVVVSGIALLSFGLIFAQPLNWTFYGSGSIFGFYSPFTRVWEFASGGLLFLVLSKFSVALRPRLMSAIGALGLAMLGASLWLISESTPFPGPWTLLPVVGTVFLLFAGTQKNVVSQLLSRGPLVKAGDWSYSIYLWHWPFIVFAIYFWPFSFWAPILAVGLSMVPALASYYFVEQPVRKRQLLTRAQIVKLVAYSMIPAILVTGLAGAVAKFYWQPQYSSETRKVFFEGDLFPKDGSWEYLLGPYFRCEEIASLYEGTVTALLTTAGCGQSRLDSPVDIAILGDSHAQHLFNGLATALPEKNVAYFAVSGVQPVADNAEMSRIINFVSEDESIQDVIISANWLRYELSDSKLAQTLRLLNSQGKNVFLTDDLPTYPFSSAQCKYGISPLLPTTRCSQEREAFKAAYDSYYPILERAIEQVPSARMLNTADYFCDTDTCSMTRDGILLYADGGHLNIQGSRYLIDRLLKENAVFKAMG